MVGLFLFAFSLMSLLVRCVNARRGLTHLGEEVEQRVLALRDVIICESGVRMGPAACIDLHLAQLLDNNQVAGRVRASSLRKIGEIVDKHPEEAVAILRNWIYQEA